MSDSPDLLLAIDRSGGLRGRSLENALRDGIRSGRLSAGLRLPGTRSLATDLGLARGTVVQAYSQLVAEGWLVPAPGSGTRVADVPAPGRVPADRPHSSSPRPPAIEWRPGVPDLSSFPRTAAVRLAWLVVPEPLRRELVDVVGESGAAVSTLDQLALADLIATGGYDRHIRRMRHAYRRRQAELSRRLGRPLEGIAAGMHALLPLDSADTERALVRDGRRAGLHLTGLHTHGYWHDAGDHQRAALVLGYAAPPAHHWDEALTALDRTIKSALDRSS